MGRATAVGDAVTDPVDLLYAAPGTVYLDEEDRVWLIDGSTERMYCAQDGADAQYDLDDVPLPLRVLHRPATPPGSPERVIPAGAVEAGARAHYEAVVAEIPGAPTWNTLGPDIKAVERRTARTVLSAAAEHLAVKPNRADVARAVDPDAWNNAVYALAGTATQRGRQQRALDRADIVLATWPGKTVIEWQAQALRDFADTLDANDPYRTVLHGRARALIQGDRP